MTAIPRRMPGDPSWISGRDVIGSFTQVGSVKCVTVTIGSRPLERIAASTSR